MATLANVAGDPLALFASDVRAGLSKKRQKELPSKYLYDPLGFALFETISLLPEYGRRARMSGCSAGTARRS